MSSSSAISSSSAPYHKQNRIKYSSCIIISIYLIVKTCNLSKGYISFLKSIYILLLSLKHLRMICLEYTIDKSFTNRFGPTLVLQQVFGQFCIWTTYCLGFSLYPLILAGGTQEILSSNKVI